jgi:hypothetical protein
MSSCVEDSAVALRYRCVCVEGATGTPGPTGSGCIVPSLTSSDGIVFISVSDSDDISFQLGSDVHTILAFSGRLQFIESGIVVDGFTSTQVAALSTTIASQLDQASSDTQTSFRASLTAQVSAIVESTFNDASSKSALAIDTAEARASALAALTLLKANAYASAQYLVQAESDRSTAKVFDAQVFTSSTSYTDTVKGDFGVLIAGET